MKRKYFEIGCQVQDDNRKRQNEMRNNSGPETTQVFVPVSAATTKI